MRYLRGGAEREAVIREAIARGGVFTEACGGLQAGVVSHSNAAKAPT
jgi:hypothetical protein